MSVEAFSGTASEWDAMVRSYDGWSHNQLFGWGEVIRESLGHTPIRLTAFANGERAGLQLVPVTSRLFGRYLVSMPFLNYGGIVGRGEAVSLLEAAAQEIARERRMDLLQLRESMPRPSTLRTANRKITVLLPLPDTAEALRKGLDAKVRNQVKRAEKEGITVKFGADQVEPFYRVFTENMRDLGTPVLPRRFFTSLMETFPDSAWFACAYLGAVPVAAGCAVRWHDTAEITWASSLRRFSKQSPNMLLYFEIMRHAIESGVRVFDFGRCTRDSGTHRFKMQWGGSEHELPWFEWSSEPGYATPSPSDSKYSLGPRLWSRLPVSVANVIGPHLVRLIP
jgi:FemAB-related protein (PEP-CTERM system-associated)